LDELMKSTSRYGAVSSEEAFLHHSEQHSRIEQEQRLVCPVSWQICCDTCLYLVVLTRVSLAC
jgi:hypothetical protein